MEKKGSILTPIWSSTAGRCAVPRNRHVTFWRLDFGLSSLQGGNERGEKNSQRRVRVIDCVLLCSWDDLLRDGVADVAGLSVVVPWVEVNFCRIPDCKLYRTDTVVRVERTCENLDIVGHDVQNLLPPIIPEGFAREVPVLVPLWQVFSRQRGPVGEQCRQDPGTYWCRSRG